MTFERARNEENKKIRLDQIKDAAKKLFDEMDYHEISISKIGKEINFTRGNLYKYITSKEDIYLHIMIDELNNFVDDFEASLAKGERLDTKALAYKWAAILSRYPRYLKLFSILFTFLEKNSNLDLLVSFKNQLAVNQARMLNVIKYNIPEFTNEDIISLLQLSFSFLMGMYPLCNPSDVQREATKLSDYEYTFPDFVESFSKTLVLIINGIKLSKM